LQKRSKQSISQWAFRGTIPVSLSPQVAGCLVAAPQVPATCPLCRKVISPAGPFTNKLSYSAFFDLPQNFPSTSVGSSVTAHKSLHAQWFCTNHGTSPTQASRQGRKVAEEFIRRGAMIAFFCRSACGRRRLRPFPADQTNFFFEMAVLRAFRFCLFCLSEEFSPGGL